ncbi:MAG TPA: FIST N-terminal domain-containing protein [Chthoniobacterales bacterium]|jgi:small ligand-binding sensory domain FIST|nr:FIST N-terminal domain-containing protein [Chthoniobacterales bacterium]
MEACAGSRLILGEFRESAVVAAAEQALAECGGQPTCGFLFLSPSWLPQIPEVLDLVRLHGRIPLLLGSVGAGLIGRSQEAEGVAGMSLLLVRLPETKLTPVLISSEQIEESTGPAYWQMETGIGPDDVDSWIVLANPYAPDLERWLAEWNVAFPDAPSIGGLSSGAGDGGEKALLLDGKAIDAAVLALAVKGGKVRTIVSQGCKPVGEPFTITQAEDNLVYALGSRPAYQVLSETFNGLSEEEKERARGNLFAGLAASEYVADLKRGDFLVRNLLGADPQTGAVAIGTRARTGQTLQYQLRDKITAHADLVELAKMKGRRGGEPFASLVFSCNGRGHRFFGVPDHDAATLAEIFGPMPSAGLFCNGEIGPIGHASYLHGYTASVALFCK